MPTTPLMSLAARSRLERSDQRNPAADAGFVGHTDPASSGRGQDRWSVLGHNFLVGGDHVFAVLDGGEDHRPGGLLAADQLDHDVHVGIVDDLMGAGHQRHPDRHLARLRRVAHQDLADLYRSADATFERSVLCQEHARDAGADRAQTEEPDPERSSHAAWSARRRSNLFRGRLDLTGYGRLSLGGDA